MPLQCDNMSFQNYYERLNEMKDASQVVFYDYYSYAAICAAILAFS